MHRIPLVAAAAALLVALSGCSVTELFSNTEQARFPNRAALQKSAPLVFREANWLPTDVFSISTKDFVKKPGNIITFASAGGVTDPACTSGPLKGKSPVKAGWWPSDAPAKGLTCGDWKVFVLQGQWYGWTD
jgi:hypothetical protein